MDGESQCGLCDDATITIQDFVDICQPDPRLHYRLPTLCPAPTDLVLRGQLWPTGSVGRGAQGQ